MHNCKHVQEIKW